MGTAQKPSRIRPKGGLRRRRSTCAVACTLDLVGDRWTLLLIRDLLGGRKRYGELLGSPEGIPTNILAARLTRLENYALIRRIAYSVHPPRFQYELTPMGRELGRPVAAIANWGLKNIPGTTRTLWPATELGGS